MKEIIKIFEYIVVYFIPILSISIQLFSELKAKKSEEKVTAELAKNEVNFTIEENNGQIIINQNTDTINQKLQEQVEQYNRKLENSKFYSRVLFKISSYIFLAIIILNFTYQIINVLDTLSAAPWPLANLFTNQNAETKFHVLIIAFKDALPSIYNQILQFIALFLLINSIKWGARIYLSVRGSTGKFLYYLFVSSIYFYNSMLNFSSTINSYTQRLLPYLKDSSQVFVTLISTFILLYIGLTVSEVTVNRFFDLQKAEKKSTVQNFIINSMDNFITQLLIPIFIFIVIRYIS